MNRNRLGIGVLVVLGTGVICGPASALDWEKITINGYTSVEMEKQIEPEGSGKGDPHSSFDSDGFDLVLNFQATDNVRASADLTWEHGAASEDGRGNIGVEYAFIEYAVSDAFRIRAGKMFTPFGIFNEIHTAKPAFLTVKEAASLNKTERIVKGAFRFYPRWGAGIEVTGDGFVGDSRFEYSAMVANGDYESDDNPFESDNNNSKSLTGRLRFEPTDAIRVGASFYHDKYNDSEYDSITSEGIEFEFDQGGFQLWAEAAYGTLKKLDGSRTKQIGAYVQPSYHFECGLTPYLRFDWIDPDTKDDDDRGHDLIIGVNYEVAKWCMLKLENNWFKGQKNTNLDDYPGGDYNEIKAALVLGW